jgi:hypothetical protein
VAAKEVGRGIRVQARQVGFWHKCREALVLKPAKSYVWVGLVLMPWKSSLSDRNLWPALLALLIQKPIDLQPPGRSIA